MNLRLKFRIFIPVFFTLGFLLFQPAAQAEGGSPRSLFVSVIQDPPVLSSREGIHELIAFSQKNKISILFVQIYRANKAWFPSNAAADSAPYQENLKKLGEDPFALLIREAHQAGIEVHAWMNLLSLSVNENAPILKKYGADILTRNLEEKKTLQDYKIDSQYFLEPGDPRVAYELSKMIGEVTAAYPDLDGIQMDYIRYPDSHPFYGYTLTNMENFTKVSGQKEIREDNPDWKQWRRDQVTALVEELVRKAHSIHPKLQVSTTGCAPYARAYEEAFQDWGAWLDRGIVDFVTMMSYAPEIQVFEKQIQDAKTKTVDFKKVNIAMPAYKLGVSSPDIFSQQLAACEKSGSRGCTAFHYGSFLEYPALISAFEDQGCREGAVCS